MGDSWDAEDFVPALPKAGNAWGEEPEALADDWEAAMEEVTKKEDEQNATSSTATTDKTATKKKDKKSKSKKEKDGDEVEEKMLTKAELEARVKASDMDFFISTTLGGGSGANGLSLDKLSLASKESIETAAKTLCSALDPVKESEEYVDFLSKLFEQLCLDISADNVKRLGKEVTALGAEKLKMEKEQDKLKQPKSKKKQTVNISKVANNDLYGDFEALNDAQGEADLDEDDFM